MWSPLEDTPEAASLMDGSPVADLRPVEAAILGKLYEGKKPAQIAEELGQSISMVRATLKKPAFLAATRTVQENMALQIARGEFGVMAFFKSKNMGAAKRLYRLSKTAEDERVFLQANLEVLKFGGIKQPAPQVTENVDRLIDQFTAAEADAFARDRVWPARFADQLARLSVNVIREHEHAALQPTVEVLGKDGDF